MENTKKEIKVNSKDLSAILKKIKPVIPVNSVLSSLECVLISVSDKHRISITAGNLETYAVCNISGKCNDAVRFLVPFKQLFALVQNLPVAQVSLNYDDVNKWVSIVCEEATYQIACEDSDNFPVTPDAGEILTHRGFSDRMAEDCQKATLFTRSDTLRPAMTGVYFDYKRNSLQIVSTDAHCLFVSDTYDSVFDKKGFIVASKVVEYICKVAKKEFLNVGFSETHAIFYNDNLFIISRLIDVSFPKYDAIIPLHKNCFSANRASLIQAIKSLIPVANCTTNQIIFEVNGSLKIEAYDLDFGNTGKKEIAVSNPANLQYNFAFNGKALLQILNSCNSHNVNIYNDGKPTAAFIFKEGDEKTMLLGMPLMLSA